MLLMSSYSWLNRNSLLLSSLFGLVCFVVLVLVKIKASLSYIPDLSGSETSTIFPIQLLIDSDQIYTDPEKAPFRLTQYTPIYFCIVSFFYKLTDWPASEVHKVFVASRLFSLIFTFCSTVLAGLLIFKLTYRNKVVAILAALFIYHVLAFWLLTGSRPDSLLVLMTSLYLWSVYAAVSSDRNTDIWWYLAIFVAVTAFFVKQSGAIHSIALGLFFIVTGQWKLLFKVTAAGIAVFALYLLILPVNTIPLFFTNIIGGVANSTSLEWFYSWTMEKWVLQFAVIMVLNFTISLYHLFKRPTPFDVFLAIASFLFFLFATSTSLKIGAGVGYYQDYIVISVVQIATFLVSEAGQRKLGGEFGKIAVSLYLVFVFLHCSLYVFMYYRTALSQNFQGAYIEQREVVKYLNDKGLKKQDWVLVDGGPDFSGYFISHFLYDQNLIPFKDLVYLADKNKTFNFSEFKSMVNSGKIRFIITDHGRSPQNILNYSFANTLKLSSTVGPYDIYESKILQNIDL